MECFQTLAISLCNLDAIVSYLHSKLFVNGILFVIYRQWKSISKNDGQCLRKLKSYGFRKKNAHLVTQNYISSQETDKAEKSSQFT